MTDMSTRIVVKTARYEFTHEELQAVFNRVAPKPNWKERISTFVILQGDPEKEIAAIHEAVKFFAGCTAAIDYTHDSTQTLPKISVMACGYYIAVGA